MVPSPQHKEAQQMTQTAAAYFTAEQLVQRWNGVVQKGTLNNWRSAKPRRGPPFVKIGGRVLYPVADVMEWERAHLHAANDNTQSRQSAA
jgi:hypothetical protein